METLKNFLTGLLVIIVGSVILLFVALTWPLIVGLSSFIMTIFTGLIFIAMIFFVIFLIGYFVRNVIKPE